MSVSLGLTGLCWVAAKVMSVVDTFFCAFPEVFQEVGRVWTSLWVDTVFYLRGQAL